MLGGIEHQMLRSDYELVECVALFVKNNLSERKGLKSKHGRRVKRSGKMGPGRGTAGTVPDYH